MPELPEVETVRTGLESVIVGSRIASLEAHDADIVLGGISLDVLRGLLVGREIRSIARRGKYLLVTVEGENVLRVHLGMTGQFLHLESSEPLQRFERVRISLDPAGALVFADARKFGRLHLVSPDELREFDRRMGPEPLGSGFTANWLAGMCGNRKRPVKALLLDQAILAGVGNIYADEALFRAAIRPDRPAGGLTPDEIRRLHRAIRKVLRSGIQNRGTSFSSYRDSGGNRGDNQRTLQVYGRGRLGQPCFKCGTELTFSVVGGRTSHFCPTCQR